MTPEAKAARKAVTPNEPKPWVAFTGAAIASAFGLEWAGIPNGDFIGMWVIGTALLGVLIWSFQQTAYKGGFKDGCECCRGKVHDDD